MKKFKKILSAVSAAVLCALPAMNGVAANASDEPKNTYKVYCDVPRNSGIKMASFTINFDNMIIESSNTGNLGGSLTTVQARLPEYEQFGLVYDAPKVLVNPGTLFTIKFIADYEFDECKVNMHADAYDKSSKLMSVNPITTYVVLMGDADNDGKVTLRDTVAINRYINNLSVDINFEAADVNEDGEINGDDSLMLMDYLVGNITHF